MKERIAKEKTLLMIKNNVFESQEYLNFCKCIFTNQKKKKNEKE